MGEVTLAARDGTDHRNGEPARPLRRHRTLPGGRAVVGALLVTLAAVGSFAAYTDATTDRRIGYIVAGSDLDIGQRISRSSLGFLPMELPALVRRRSFRDPDALLGAVVVAPVNKGELVQASDVLIRGSAPGGMEVSFSIDSARAVDGRLQRGELIDVLVTYGTGTEAYTVVVARQVRVVSRRHPRGTLSESGEEVVTVSVPASSEAVALTHAVTAGEVTLVRTAGGAGAPNETDSGTGTGTGYRPTRPQAMATSEDEPPSTDATLHG
ncbi:MAG TPA: SAF domain-containing protein [Acidimicrobiales bacterium]|nr:SAF domain-containing protein [Acidimicrobiales bacterium]